MLPNKMLRITGWQTSESHWIISIYRWNKVSPHKIKTNKRGQTITAQSHGSACFVLEMTVCMSERGKKEIQKNTSLKNELVLMSSLCFIPFFLPWNTKESRFSIQLQFYDVTVIKVIHVSHALDSKSETIKLTCVRNSSCQSLIIFITIVNCDQIIESVCWTWELVQSWII